MPEDNRKALLNTTCHTNIKMAGYVCTSIFFNIRILYQSFISVDTECTKPFHHWVCNKTFLWFNYKVEQKKLIKSRVVLHFHYMMSVIAFVKGRKCLTPVFRFWEPANNIWLHPKTKLEKVLTLGNLLRVQATVNLTSTTL